MIVGDVLQNVCCNGFGFEVLDIVELQPDDKSVWGICHNPGCPVVCGCGDVPCYWDGISHYCLDDLDEVLAFGDGAIGG